MRRPGEEDSPLEGLALKKVIVIGLEPTVLDAFGVQKGTAMEGRSLI